MLLSKAKINASETANGKIVKEQYTNFYYLLQDLHYSYPSGLPSIVGGNNFTKAISKYITTVLHDTNTFDYVIKGVNLSNDAECGIAYDCLK